MCDRRARTATLALILAFPLLMALTSGLAPGRETASTVLGVEAVLVAGLLVVAKARGVLLATPAAEVQLNSGLSRPRSVRARESRRVAAELARRTG